MNGHMYFKDKETYSREYNKAMSAWKKTLSKKKLRSLENPNEREKSKEQQKSETSALRKKARLCKRLSKHSKYNVWSIWQMLLNLLLWDLEVAPNTESWKRQSRAAGLGGINNHLNSAKWSSLTSTNSPSNLPATPPKGLQPRLNQVDGKTVEE